MFSLLKKKISGIADKIHGEVTLDDAKLDEVLWDFEAALLESDVALEVCEKIIQNLKKSLFGRKVKKDELLGLIKKSLEESLADIFISAPDFMKLLKNKPYVIVFVGVNGTGKTTTIAKIAYLLKKNNLSSVIAASDTFRAGAIEQLEKHARNLGIRLIKHAKGADPSAVAFDAIKHASAHSVDAVLIDTAGRMETNANLLDEMKKIVRVTKPGMTLFVCDALAGNAALEQAEKFAKAVPIDGVILTKVDADAKGGSAISISHAIKKPIFFLGTGQRYEDLRQFDAGWFIKQLLG